MKKRILLIGIIGLFALVFLPQHYLKAQAICLDSQSHIIWQGGQALGDIPTRGGLVDNLISAGLRWVRGILEIPGSIEATGNIKAIGDVGGKRLCINKPTGPDCRDVWPEVKLPTEQTIPFELYDKPKSQGGKVIFRIILQ